MAARGHPMHPPMGRRHLTGRALAAIVLIVATIAVYATEWLAFMWPLIALVDAKVAIDWRRRARA
jgi:hypothetical protein